MSTVLDAPAELTEADLVAIRTSPEPEASAWKLGKWVLYGFVASAFFHGVLVTASVRLQVPSSMSRQSELEYAFHTVKRPQWHATDALQLISEFKPSIAKNEKREGGAPGPPIQIEPKKAVRRVSTANAVDRIFLEIDQVLWTRRKVLVVWCFDQSETMQPDRELIAGKISNAYQRFKSELPKQVKTDQNKRQAISRFDLRLLPRDAVATSVMSFGESTTLHTIAPTSKKEIIAKAIRSIPVDDSGVRRTCRAVAQAVGYHKQFKSYEIDKEAEGSAEGEAAENKVVEANTVDTERQAIRKEAIFKGDRKMVLILVTDEAGDLRGNYRDLESTVEIAQEAACRIYVLGRESVFGHPYAPAVALTNRQKIRNPIHVDQGTETARPEILQADGLGTREDLRPAGFGPYEQSRLVYATGGIFFMCPSPADTQTLIKERGRRMLASRQYVPNLLPRAEYEVWRDTSNFRSTIVSVVELLNPRENASFNDTAPEGDNGGFIYRPPLPTEVEKQLRFDFPYARGPFLAAARPALSDAERLFKYFSRNLMRLHELTAGRDQEPSARWRANYDLLRAEMAMLKSRTYEYGMALKAAMATHPQAPRGATRIRFVERRETLADQSKVAYKSRDYGNEAKQLLQFVVKHHLYTPWGDRAQAELQRGFGVQIEVH